MSSSGTRLVAGLDQGRQLVADAERALLVLEALDGVALADQVPVGLGFRGTGNGRGVGHRVPRVGFWARERASRRRRNTWRRPYNACPPW